MKVNMELDGEPISIEQSSPSDNSTGLNQREDFPYFNNSFNNADGINHADSEGRIRMVAASAAQNTPNYFDQDNFYPADGQQGGFFRNIGQSISTNVKDVFSPESSKERQSSRVSNRADRKDVRRGKKESKTDERKSRADLNRAVGQDKASDIELAKALGGSDKQPMSTTTKVLIGVGVLAVVGAIAYFVIKKKK
jgi:hypothetical protein